MNISRSINNHLKEPDISIDQHTNRCIKALGQSLRSRRAVYLDMRFWIIIRDVVRRGTDSASQIFLELLRKKTNEGLIFCPISESIFVELMKQSDPASRTMTANLMDELSLGITLIPEHMRFATEVTHFFRTSLGQTDLLPLEDLVWCKLSYVFGFLHPSNTPFDESTERAMQKAFFDHMWTIPLTQIIDLLGDTKFPGSYLNDLANELNAGIAAHADELRSFKQAYMAEVRGAVELAGGIAADTISEIAAASGVTLAGPTPEERRRAENNCENLMALVLEKGKAQKQLRTIHILASLHASLRWNKGQKFVGNDIYDFHHATAAIAYCDAFFTEGPLCKMIRQNHLKFGELFNCHVTADIDEAVAWLEAIK
ncbi:hypothetical protein HPQ64_16140 [Rhizobiales bacterium]|uniref:hypothetical protein n=1 Tax=Hongsoonwoonella zoysiae TaxID=2821844 RepID=UPI00156012B8|nr:hypothetical protein [Hongsoonwoonella zoysiae]NRG19221.1 hypothetical protein [Hongsoonwoonella zoysiae]